MPVEVKSIRFDRVNGDGHVRIEQEDGSVYLLNAPDIKDAAEVLADYDKGEFDFIGSFPFGMADEPQNVAQWEVDHPNATLIKGE